MSQSARQNKRGGTYYSFQDYFPVDDDDASAVASNDLLTALRYASGTTLVRYSLADDDRPATPSQRGSGPPCHGLFASEELLTVEDAVDATQMLQEFRAVQWSAMVRLWTRAGNDLPPLLEGAAEILGSVATDWESVRRVEYLGIACRDVVDTHVDIGDPEAFSCDDSDPLILFGCMALMCHAELLDAAKAVDVALVIVGGTTGLLSENAAAARSARVLDALNPFQVSVKATGRGRSQAQRCSRRSR